MKQLTWTVIAIAAWMPCHSQSVDPEQSARAPIDEIVVTGEQPGPSLWKVTNGDHTLWILGITSPLPKKMVWRSKNVEALVARAQEVITAGEAKQQVRVGLWETVKAIPAIGRMINNPNDATLADILEPSVYAQWSDLEKEYVGHKSHSLERHRPVFALMELQTKALEKSGLSTASVVWPVVRAAARKNGVQITSPDVKYDVKIDHASKRVDKLSKSFDHLSKKGIDERECFAQQLDRLRPNVRLMKSRANAWAVGDIPVLLNLYRSALIRDCMSEFRESLFAMEEESGELNAKELSSVIKGNEDRANEEVRRKWLAAIDRALATNATTFAMLPIYDLVNRKGRLALLREKGYEIDAPYSEGPAAKK